MTKKSSGFKMRGFSGFGEGTSPLKGATTTTGLENLSSLSGGGDTGGGGSDSGGSWWSKLSADSKAGMIKGGVQLAGNLFKKKESKKTRSVATDFSKVNFGKA